MFRMLIALCAVAICATNALADTGVLGKVTFNQHEIEDKARRVDLSDPITVFAQIFSQLDDEVVVYPTENYYYFTFFANGRKYSGNFRLHPVQRDEGKITFAYFDASNRSWIRYRHLGAKDNVIVESVADLTYSVRFRQRTVLFHLNSVNQESPSAQILRAGEEFVGRSFDESGLVLLLVFNHQSNGFLWILDPEQMVEVVMTELSPTLFLHVLSGFTFFRSPGVDRLVLLAVDHWNVVRNTYFDGPFDQLPDNWLADTSFRTLAERVLPGTKGRINSRGEYKDIEARVAIQPYRHYRSLTQVLAHEAACWQRQRSIPEWSGALMRCLFGMDQ